MVTISPKLPGENNKEFAYRIIKDSIMSLELEPGQAISEIELAAALQISRTPIREVLGKLREEHLVEVIPQVGTYISKIKPQLIKEASFMRYTLEKEILKLSCEQFPKANLFDLKKNLALQEDLIGCKGKEREFHKLDKEFHRIIFEGKKNENIWTAIMRISTHYNRIRLLSEMQHNFDEPIAQHAKIIEILETKDCDAVEEIVRQHIVEPMKHWDDLFKEGSPYIKYFEMVDQNPVFL
ncbi:GntR family transcriptional regulator [Neobacillus niacini]|uniref:GntR family transcriptional regulator n=1 Tax=Neobacillus niacini TaxID=86668 RepID=UPI0021CB8704|nr:GntR family transcriptional regulator [Neobacillus niacini]MCM3768240.1 GntR family transcriptional regulator [Neobacillus niacini]